MQLRARSKFPQKMVRRQSLFTLLSLLRLDLNRLGALYRENKTIYLLEKLNTALYNIIKNQARDFSYENGNKRHYKRKI